MSNFKKSDRDRKKNMEKKLWWQNQSVKKYL